MERFYNGTVEEVVEVRENKCIDDFIKLDNSDLYFGMHVHTNRRFGINLPNWKRAKKGNYIELEIHSLLNTEFYNEVIHFYDLSMRGYDYHECEFNGKMLTESFFRGHDGGWIKEMEVYKDDTKERLLFRYGSKTINSNKEKTKISA
ncbi:MAG: hypothetical protein KJ613_02455 [Nanoarchaeota archaeon]|nr:hypothetical protein [Nanoarchaeota archaeon]MBU1135628.1 hypothetical protein [Nanoarchaeota archaeon]